jgi:hypothetical protein
MMNLLSIIPIVTTILGLADGTIRNLTKLHSKKPAKFAGSQVSPDLHGGGEPYRIGKHRDRCIDWLSRPVLMIGRYSRYLAYISAINFFQYSQYIVLFCSYFIANFYCVNAKLMTD